MGINRESFIEIPEKNWGAYQIDISVSPSGYPWSVSRSQYKNILIGAGGVFVIYSLTIFP